MFKNSANFTLKEYSGQIDFYEEYLTKYDGFVTYLQGASQEKNINIDDKIGVLDRINQALNTLKESGRLNYGHFLGSYLQVFIYMDEVRNIRTTGFDNIIGMPEILPSDEISQIVNILEIFSERHPRIVPFTTRTGAFGMNTFMYLYFNGIYPVAASIDPYPVHNGIFPGSVATMGHDFTHLPRLRKLDGSYRDDIGIRSYISVNDPYPESVNQYYKNIKSSYVNMFTP